jgi:N-acyl-phosphatidylethanolamine-hydrolysing phospholipase D
VTNARAAHPASDGALENPRAQPLSHHAPHGGFRNPWPNAELHGFKDFLRWRFGGRRQPRAPTPARGSFPARAPAIVAPRAPSGRRAVTWVGHSTALLQLGALNVLTDPVWSERASPVQWIGPRRVMPPAVAFDALPEIDVVLLSHNHYDHLDKRTVERLAARFPDATWLCPLGLRAFLAARGVRRIEQRDWWQTVDGKGYTAVCTPAQHFSARGLRDRNRTLWCGWTLAHDGARVFFAGDTALHPEFAAIGERCGPFDLIMLPIGAYEPRGS